MKKPLLLFTPFALLTLLLWLAITRRDSSEAASPSAQTQALKSTAAAPSVSDAKTAPLHRPMLDEDDALDAASEARRERERQEEIEKANREYNTPISFFGLVLDQSDQPVPSARVEYDSVGGSFEGDRELLADTQGRFTISGIRGKRLRVRVTHPNYYNDNYGSSYFVYAGNPDGPDFKPDPARPEIFRLRKKGEAAELVHLESRVRFDGDEPECSFSLFDHTRRRDRPEYILLRRVETAERDAQGRPVRRLEMVVPAGGIQQRTDEFQFIAPTGGYQPSMYFMRPPFGGKLDYFVKFDTGNYARFTIMGSAGDYLIDSYLNPDGSPNLEYDREKGITVVPTGRMGIDLLYPPKSDPPPKP